MARRVFSTQQLALSDWTDWTSDNNGQFGWDQIQTANLAFQSRELQRIAFALENIRALMLQLGADGIHDVLRYHKHKVVRAQQQLAAAKRRQRRAKRLARKKVA